jgi:hypothetical protein
VNWRVVLTLFACVLLAVPLILVLGMMLRPRWPEAGPGVHRISPVLTAEERMRLSTYHRDCGSGQACEPPLGCVTDVRIRAQYCTDSQCSTDSQCPADQRCMSIATRGNEPLVRFCVPVGRRQEGEHCFALPGDKDEACATGLQCGGREGWCARPCEPSAAAACPEGFFCSNTAPAPLCLPTCEARGCPAGQQCTRFAEGVSVCAEAYGPQCQQSPCPRGGECTVGQDVQRPGKVWMECTERCGDGRPPCGAGLICDAWLCRAPCNPQDPHPCMEGYRCKQSAQDRPYACQPDW